MVSCASNPVLRRLHEVQNRAVLKAWQVSPAVATLWALTTVAAGCGVWTLAILAGAVAIYSLVIRHEDAPSGS